MSTIPAESAPGDARAAGGAGGCANAGRCARRPGGNGNGFVGAVREPPVLTAWADNPAIARSVGGAGRSRTTPTECSRIGGMGTRRRTTTGGCPYGIESPPRESRRPANGAQECAPYGRNARRTITERGVYVSAGAAPPRGRPTIREPPVFRKEIKTPDSGLRRNDGIPGRRAAEGKSSLPSRCRSLSDRRDAGVGLSPSFRRKPESRTGARGGERAFPVNPCAGSWFRRGGPLWPPVVNGEDGVEIL